MLFAGSPAFFFLKMLFMIFQIVIEICFYFVVLSLHHDGEHACLKVNRSYEVGIEFGKYGIGRVVCAAEVYAE